MSMFFLCINFYERYWFIISVGYYFFVIFYRIHVNILYLIPPSEWKAIWGNGENETLSFWFSQPQKIASSATEKDLKCKWKRYEEGIYLNKNIEDGPFLPVIERYWGVMYNSIDYNWMSKEGKQYFDDHFLILSGMYGILKPQDIIGNYKLPIETKGLYVFWGSKITDAINSLKKDIVVNFLPGAYSKMIDWKKVDATIVSVHFFEVKKWEVKKMTHGVKSVKWQYIQDICMKSLSCIEDFPWEIVQISEEEFEIQVIC